MEIDRNAFIAGLGGTSALDQMSDEAKADALEDHLLFQLASSTKLPTVAEIEAQIESRPFRISGGRLPAASFWGLTRNLPADLPVTMGSHELRVRQRTRARVVSFAG